MIEGKKKFYMTIRNDLYTDLHRERAALLFNKPESQVTSEEREFCKKLTMCQNYGMGVRKIKEQIKNDRCAKSND